MEDKINQINNLVYKVCEQLEISVPEIKYHQAKYAESSVTTSYDRKQNIYIMEIEIVPDIRDIYFHIFHELRHIWQRVNDEEKYFATYAQLDDIGSYYYYSQIAEIDANAFSLAMMKLNYSLSPKVSTIPQEILNVIHIRETKIIKEWKK